MIEGAGLIVLGLVICGAAVFRWHHSSWSRWSYAAAGLGFAAVGVGVILVDVWL